MEEQAKNELDPEAKSELNQLAALLSGNVPGKTNDPKDFFKSGARELAKSILTYILLCEDVQDDQIDIGHYVFILSSGAIDLKDRFQKAMNPGKRGASILAYYALNLIQMPAETFNGIQGEAVLQMEEWVRDEDAIEEYNLRLAKIKKRLAALPKVKAGQ